jgi:hypothetical protein
MVHGLLLARIPVTEVDDPVQEYLSVPRNS